MSLFDQEYLTLPWLRRRPRTDAEHMDFVRSLFDVFEGALQHLSATGQITSAVAMPMVISGNVQSVQSGLSLTAEDRGGSLGSQINISAHTVAHGDVTVSYGAGTLIVDDQGADLAYSNGGEVWYSLYVDNPDYSDEASPDYKATADPQDLSENIGRYYVGRCLMPTDGGGTTYGGGGGGGGITGDGTAGNPGDIIP